MNFIRRLFSALSTIAVFMAIGAAIVIVLVSQPASYAPGSDDPNAGAGGPAIENVVAGLSAVSPYIPYLSIIFALVLAVWLGVRLRDRRQLAKRRAADAFIRIDRKSMGGKSDELIRTWEEASVAQPSRGFFGLFRRGTPPSTLFGEERPGFFARLFRRAPKPAPTPVVVDPFAAFATPSEKAASDGDGGSARVGRRPLAIVGAVFFAVAGLAVTVIGLIVGVFAWVGVPLPTALGEIDGAFAALREGIEPRLQIALLAGVSAIAIVAIALLSITVRAISRIGMRQAQVDVATPTPEPADGDAEQPYRYVDFDEPLSTPSSAPSAPPSAPPDAPGGEHGDFAALFDDAIGAASAAPQPTAPVADPVFAGESFSDSATWGQVVESAPLPAASAARPGSAVTSAELAPRPMTDLVNPDPTLFVPRRRHRIELLIGIIAGAIAGVLMAVVDPQLLISAMSDAGATVDPQLLSVALALCAGALVALLIVGAVRLARHTRRTTQPPVAPEDRPRRGRAAAVGALWILLGAGLIVGAAISIGATDPATFLSRLIAIAALVDPVTAVVVTLIVLSFFVGFLGMAATTMRRAATPVAPAATPVAPVAVIAGSSPRRTRITRGITFVLAIVIAGVIAGAGAVRLGRGIASTPATTPAPSSTLPTPSPSPLPSDATPIAGWTVVEGATGGWRIGFPAAPTIGDVSSSSGAGSLTSVTYSLTIEGTIYSVVVTDYPVGTIDAANPETIDASISSAAVAVEGEITSTRTLSIDGAPGREAYIRAKETEFRTHIYIVGSRLIQLIVGYPQNAPPLEAAAFIDSFAIIPERPAASPSPSTSPTPGTSPTPSTSPAPSTSPSPAPSGSPSGMAPEIPPPFAGRIAAHSDLTAREAVFLYERATEPLVSVRLPVVALYAHSGRRLIGRATYYDATKNHAWYTRSRPGSSYFHQDGGPYRFYAAASPALRAIAPFRWGAPPYQVVITNRLLGHTIVAWVVDECACVGGGIIDLAPAAWWVLGGSGQTPMSHGVLDVEVEVLSPPVTQST